MPFEPDMLFFLAEFAGRPRRSARAALLRRVLDKRAKHGLRRCSAGFEYEFFVFDETPRFGARQGLPRPRSRSTPGFFGYSMLRNSVHAELYHELLDLCETMTSRSRACTPRPAPACSRRRIAVDDALDAADKAALFKTFMKVLAAARGWMATFMAKWSQRLAGPERPHPHVARRTADGKAAFHDAARPRTA